MKKRYVLMAGVSLMSALPTASLNASFANETPPTAVAPTSSNNETIITKTNENGSVLEFNKKTKTLLLKDIKEVNNISKDDNKFQIVKNFVLDFIEELIKNGDLNYKEQWFIDYNGLNIQYYVIDSQINEEELKTKHLKDKNSNLQSVIHESFSAITMNNTQTDVFSTEEGRPLTNEDVKKYLDDIVNASKTKVLRNMAFKNYNIKKKRISHHQFIGFNYLPADVLMDSNFNYIFRAINCKIIGNVILPKDAYEKVDKNEEESWLWRGFNFAYFTYKTTAPLYDFSYIKPTDIRLFSSQSIDEEKANAFSEKAAREGYIDPNEAPIDIKRYIKTPLKTIPMYVAVFQSKKEHTDYRIATAMIEDYNENSDPNSIRRRFIDIDENINIKSKGFFLAQNTFKFKNDDYVVEKDGQVIGKFTGENFVGIKELLDKHGTEVLHIYSNSKKVNESNNEDIITKTNENGSILEFNVNTKTLTLKNIAESYKVPKSDGYNSIQYKNYKEFVLNFIEELIKTNKLNYKEQWFIDYNGLDFSCYRIDSNINEEEFKTKHLNDTNNIIDRTLVDTMYKLSSNHSTNDIFEYYDVFTSKPSKTLTNDDVEQLLNRLVNVSKTKVLRNVTYKNYKISINGNEESFIGLNYLPSDIILSDKINHIFKAINCKIIDNVIIPNREYTDTENEFYAPIRVFHYFTYKTTAPLYDFSNIKNTCYRGALREIGLKDDDLDEDIIKQGYLKTENTNNQPVTVPLYIASAEDDNTANLYTISINDYNTDPNSNSIRRRVVDIDENINIKGKGFFLSQNTFRFKNDEYVIEKDGQVIGKFTGSNLLGVKELLEKHGNEVLHIYKPTQNVENTTPSTNNSSTNSSSDTTATSSEATNHSSSSLDTIVNTNQSKPKSEVKDKVIATSPTELSVKMLEKYESKTAFVVASNKSIDALSISAVANYKKAPILFIDEKNHHEMIDILKKQGYTDVYIIGGEVSINKKIEDNFKKSFKTQRVSGRDRYETNVDILKLYPQNSHKAYMASGENFADALSLSPLAVKNNRYILLTRKDKVPTQIENKIKDLQINDIISIGGAESINPKIYNFSSNISGKDRYKTNEEIAKQFSTKAIITNGEDETSALIGANYAGYRNKYLKLDKDLGRNMIVEE